MIRKKWWEKKAVYGSSQWCVIGVEVSTYIPETWGIDIKTVYKSCHLSNLPTNTKLITKNLMQHEAQGLCKLLNLEEN
jgi:hypothetical protein